jgi:hypothetical protein
MSAIAIVLIVVVLAVVAAAVLFFIRRRSEEEEPVAASVPNTFRLPEREMWDEIPVVVGAPPVVPPIVVAVVTWPARIQRTGESLDAEARLRLITDLGMLRASWCVPILEQASEEETDPDLRTAAQTALAKCRRVDARGTSATQTQARTEEEPTVSSNGHATPHAPLPPQAG